MSLETASYLHQLNPSYPSGTDMQREGDDHIRLLKAAIKATFPNFTGAMNLTSTFLNDIAVHLVPFGAIMLFSGDTAPTGWAICDGRTVAKSDGSGTVTTPDMQNRVPVGASVAHALGDMFGQESYTVTAGAGGGHTHDVDLADAANHSHSVSAVGHSLTEAELPAHKHLNGISDDGAAGASSLFVYGGEAQTAIVAVGIDTNTHGGFQGYTSEVGSGTAHTHTIDQTPAGAHNHAVTVTGVAGHSHSVTTSSVQPSMALNYIMKV
ncbi:tail fiber protein [Polymorphobacter arshaanensis]|uniref:Tail fiber protein n=1 Tax=Glacieibacterium arshaanense TaxID=2511025 RepID=A0A4Y9ERB4_9SPHN|nr:tail fiber protein [Polymorphobacter arshaanensis]TFU06176.1 tail fiber protein [Polymorphobacter arshaanensis]